MNKKIIASGHTNKEILNAFLTREKYKITDTEKGEFVILHSSGEEIETFKEYGHAYEYIESYLQNKDIIDGIKEKGKQMKNNQQGNDNRPNLSNNLSTDKEQLIPLNEEWQKLRITISDKILTISDSTKNVSLQFRRDEIYPGCFQPDKITFLFSVRITLDFNIESANKIMNFISPNTSEYIDYLQNKLISMNENI